MQPSYEDQIRAAISAERLDPYGSGRGTRTAVQNYLWNMALCSALYPVLSLLEVTLRNSMDEAISARYPVSGYSRVNSWLDRVPAVLHPNDQRAVDEAIQRLVSRDEPLRHGKVVAEMTFGFWTALFDVRYEQGQVFWPPLLQRVFPHIPRSSRRRKFISPKLNRLRHLRNRVFHYEPIWHWSDLHQQHDEAIEIIRWISPAAAATLSEINQFPAVHRSAAVAFEPIVTKLA